VTHYSDDNPNTFTVKRKKDAAHPPPSPPEDEPVPAPPPPPAMVAAAAGARRGRPPKQGPQQQPQKRQQRRASSSGSTTSSNNTSNNNISSSSAKRSSPLPPPPVLAAPSTSLDAFAALAAATRNRGGSNKRAAPPPASAKHAFSSSSAPVPSRKRSKRVDEPARPEETAADDDEAEEEEEDVIIAHTATIQSALPLSALGPMAASYRSVTALSDNYSSASCTSAAAKVSLDWERLETTESPPESSGFAVSNAMLTWWSVRQDRCSEVLAGDCRGRLILYRISSGYCNNADIQRPLRIVTCTSAHQRELSRVIVSKKVICFPNAIVQCAWCRDVIAVLTASELEILSVEQDTLLCSFPVGSCLPESSQTAKRIAMQQSPNLQIMYRPTISENDFHRKNNYTVIWTTWHRELQNSNVPTNYSLLATDVEYNGWVPLQKRDAGIGGFGGTRSASSLSILLGLSKLIAASATSLTPSMFRCWTTCAEHDDSTLLLVAQTTENGVELLRCRRRPAVNGKHPIADASAETALTVHDEIVEIIVRQDIHHHGGKAMEQESQQQQENDGGDEQSYFSIKDCCLQQFRLHTFLSGAGRGIRMFVSETLAPVATFGETVQLHGKFLHWNRAYWVRAPIRPVEVRMEPIAAAGSAAATASTNKKKKQTWWLERKDVLELANNDTSTTTTEDECWLVGVPHPYKGPGELKSTLYIWKPEGVSTTLHGPPGGCMGDLSISRDSFRMVSVSAKDGDLYHWGPTLLTDFAGVMYPVGYKTITDNIEYIEDEDEVDESLPKVEHQPPLSSPDKKQGFTVLETKQAPDRDEIDPDLAEAMRLSLIELKSAEEPVGRKEQKVSVLHVDNDGDEYLVPCWPDSLKNDADDTANRGSPLRQRAFSVIDSDHAFEHAFLEFVPGCSEIRKETKEIEDKQNQEALDTSVLLDRSKSRSKRNRYANVEILMQSSLDPDLRRQMFERRGKWVDGQGSSLPKSALITTDLHDETVALPPLVQRASQLKVDIQVSSAEEKALALELLMLSPGQKNEHRSIDVEETRPIDDKDETSESALIRAAQSFERDAACGLIANETVVTPSEQSPTQASVQHSLPNADASALNRAHQPMDHNETLKEMGNFDNDATGLLCAACYGRMVLHSCGKREQPIDYEAIARAEQERKDREAAEKLRIRTERRRMAEARRRETKRLKKLEEDRKRLDEEERMRQVDQRLGNVYSQDNIEDSVYRARSTWTQSEALYSNLYASAQTQVSQLNYSPTGYRKMHADASKSEEAQSLSTYNIGSNGRHFNEDSRMDSYRSSQSWGSGLMASTHSSHQGTFNINGNEVQPSTSLHPTDALAALAGLADSLSNPVESNAPLDRHLNNINSSNVNEQARHIYEYHGSDQRRVDIAQALAATLNPQSVSQKPLNSLHHAFGESTAISTDELNFSAQGVSTVPLYSTPLVASQTPGRVQTQIIYHDTASNGEPFPPTETILPVETTVSVPASESTIFSIDSIELNREMQDLSTANEAEPSSAKGAFAVEQLSTNSSLPIAKMSSHRSELANNKADVVQDTSSAPKSVVDVQVQSVQVPAVSVPIMGQTQQSLSVSSLPSFGVSQGETHQHAHNERGAETIGATLLAQLSGGIDISAVASNQPNGSGDSFQGTMMNEDAAKSLTDSVPST
jgi:hypothetical protein